MQQIGEESRILNKYPRRYTLMRHRDFCNFALHDGERCGRASAPFYRNPQPEA
jgi:hypothetical protein